MIMHDIGSLIDEVKALLENENLSVGEWEHLYINEEDGGSPSRILILRMSMNEEKDVVVARISNTTSGRPLDERDFTNAKYISLMSPENVRKLISYIHTLESNSK